MVTDRYQHIRHVASAAELGDYAAQAGYAVVAIDNLPGAVPLETVALPRNALLLFGQEGTGLTAQARAVATMVCSIAQYGSTRSINAGVAAGIAMHAWIRQHADDALQPSNSGPCSSRSDDNIKLWEPQVPAEVRHGERDPAALAGIDQALLQQGVARRRQRLRRPAQRLRHSAVEHGVAGVGDVGHRAQVFAFGRRGALVARAEEADRELGLGLRRGQRDVGFGDRRARRDVPRGLAVGLHEVGVAAGRSYIASSASSVNSASSSRAGDVQRGVGRGAIEPADAGVAEQPLGVGLARRQDGRQVRQAGPDDDQRQALLRDLVARRAQRRDVERGRGPAARR